MVPYLADSALVSYARVQGRFCAQLTLTCGQSLGRVEATTLAELRTRALELVRGAKLPWGWGGLVQVEAVSPRGRSFVLELTGRRQRVLAQDAEGYRRSPVRWTGSGRGFYPWREPRTQNERRLNARVPDELEPPVRAARRYLPSNYDDIARDFSACWKRQHKGRKAWDRRRR